MLLPSLTVCFLHLPSAFSDHGLMALNGIWWLSTHRCRVRGKEGQGDKQGEQCTVYGNSKQTCQWEILAPVSGVWTYVWTCVSSPGKRGHGSRVHRYGLPCHGAVIGPSLQIWSQEIGSGAASPAQRCPPRAELPIKPASRAAVHTGRKVLLLPLLLRDPQKGWENQVPWF